MINRLWALFLLAGCSSGDAFKIDYTVAFTDGANRDVGVVESGSLGSIQATSPAKVLKGSTATFEVKSDMAGLHFVIVEDGFRRGSLLCVAQTGTTSASANAEVATGGHYLISAKTTGARCIPEQ